ncbi:SRPBCC family protein [Haloechinothrix halophila]|uniref:SRPBCC family protein n=1 Tax=Haloechinothrix halophila TaxID=1069073 RepID=UPI00041CE2BE|nr:SRPBCC family protein [Haloechinothrix halophila]
MQLEHEFAVEAPITEVWQALQDPERVAPCMPGATLTGVEGDTFTAKVKVKLGPVMMQYKGTGEFVEKDESAHKLVISASGKDVRGAGTAATRSTVTLTGNGERTTGSVISDVKVTGKPAQFGRGLISEVSGRLLAEFAANLAGELAPAKAATSGATGAAATTEASPDTMAAEEARESGESGEPVAPREREPLDLMGVAGAPVLKRVLPVVAVLAAIAAVVVIVRACGKG